MFVSGTYRVWQTEIGSEEPDPASQEAGVLVVAGDEAGQTSYWVPTHGSVSFPFVSDSDTEYWLYRVGSADPVGHSIQAATIEVENVDPIIHDWQPWLIEIDGAVAAMAFSHQKSSEEFSCVVGEPPSTKFPYEVAQNTFARLSPDGEAVDKAEIEAILENQFGNGWKGTERGLTKH